MTNESPEQRSRIMRAVKGQDTRPEMIVRRIVRELGHRYRLHRKDIPGNPDLAFIGKRKVIFIHGCFWHGHTCKRGARMPERNRDYWMKKIGGNVTRDERNLTLLHQSGWSVLVIWECELKARTLDDVATRVGEFLG